MVRRLAGAMLVLLTVVAAAVISSATGRGVAGSATVAELPGPPTVGDCLLTDGRRQPNTVQLNGAQATDPGIPGFGPCGTAGVGSAVGKVGEVVAVRMLTGADRTAAGNTEGCRSSALA